MADPRAVHAQLKAKQQQLARKAAPIPPAEVRTMVTDNTEAFRLRAEWMALIGNGGQDIADSPRYNRPQSVTDEQGLLDTVPIQLEWERQFTDG